MEDMIGDLAGRKLAGAEGRQGGGQGREGGERGGALFTLLVFPTKPASHNVLLSVCFACQRQILLLSISVPSPTWLREIQNNEIGIDCTTKSTKFAITSENQQNLQLPLKINKLCNYL